MSPGLTFNSSSSRHKPLLHQIYSFINLFWPVWAPGICEGPCGSPPPAVVVEADVVCGGGVVLVLVSHLVISHKRLITLSGNGNTWSSSWPSPGPQVSHRSLSGQPGQDTGEHWQWRSATESQSSLPLSPDTQPALPCPATNCPHLCQPKLVSAHKQIFVM